MTLGLAARLAESAWLSRIPVKRTDTRSNLPPKNGGLFQSCIREDLTLVMGGLDSLSLIQPNAFVWKGQPHKGATVSHNLWHGIVVC